MDESKTDRVASLVVIVSGVFWGLYWLPVRRIDEAGLPGAWATFFSVAVAAIVLAPFALWHWRRLARANPLALLYIAVGGAAFVLYSVGFVYGRVAIIILLFYLTPVWSSLIGRFVLGWRSRASRTLVIILGVLGLLVMLGGEGEIPVPRSVGEWLALAAGLLWSISSTGIRLTSNLRAVETSFVFACGALVSAAVLAPMLAPLPTGIAPDAMTPLVGWSLAAGIGWWVLNTTGLLWATARLEPARVGILLMSEVLVGAISGALLAGEHLGPFEWAGGTLVLVAAAIEIFSSSAKGGTAHAAS
ncbi:DMT family transporter [Fulvimarina sp. 2208YS6-2-32]|uniref:DMT family transporter n=1 Tax=Fulvimarina uroteuthidis TaxID=3098149 RepID=A0ABU5I4K2_9HYPH|nr:DMT family transporter [Fulvimarina sp. 2208YS6-2-32]MDY8110302.1 DMT family transporter [Fulvimarina sp. 2208YS6-2-32]